MDIGKSIVLEDGESGIIHKKLEDNWFEIMVNEGNEREDRKTKN